MTHCRYGDVNDLFLRKSKAIPHSCGFLCQILGVHSSLNVTPTVLDEPREKK